MNIKIKYIVASDAAIQTLQDLAYTCFNEKYSGILSEKRIGDYLELRYNTRSLTLLLNDFSNKCLLVFVDEKPAGYAIFSAVSKKPPVPEPTRATHLVNLEVLSMFKDSNAKQELLERFLSQSRNGQAVWTQEFADEDIVNFYVSNGFKKERVTDNLDGLPIDSIYLIKVIDQDE